jgi:oligopeptide transport system substrate-binding protein
VDEYTVEFTLEQPAGYFPTIAGMWVCRPVPKEAIDQYAEKWTEPGNIITNGPYCLDTWEHEAKLVLVKNPYWYDAKTVSIEQINIPIVAEDSTALAMYENGELDLGPVPGDQMDRIKADPVLSKELYVSPVLCTYYWGFNTTKPPFDNVKVRQAFSYALDRQKLIDTVMKGAQKPATAFAPPGIFGTPADNPEFPGIKFDAAKAQALLAEAGYPGGAGLPEITLMHNTSEGHQKLAEFYQQQIKENLGVEIKLANQEWNVYLETVQEDAPQIYRMGWCLDYPDENNWVLEVFHPTKGQNYGKWSMDDPAAAKFAEVTEQAAKESDPKKRAELYFEAEKLLTVDNAVAVMVYYYGAQGLTKPYLERTYNKQGGEGSHWNLWKVKAH